MLPHNRLLKLCDICMPFVKLKDDHLYETGLIDNPNFKLQSLGDFSAMGIPGPLR